MYEELDIYRELGCFIEMGLCPLPTDPTFYHLPSGECVLLDIQDGALVQSFKPWKAHRTQRFDHTLVYAIARCLGDKKKSILMHRLIMGADDSNMVVHHKNGNTLDNRRTNLVVQRRSQHTKEMFL